MRILLDENFPADFAKLLVGHEISTVHGLGWSGIKNGELLRRASEVCEVFVTLDRNLEFQQNIKGLPFGIPFPTAWFIPHRTSAASLLRQVASHLVPSECRCPTIGSSRRPRLRFAPAWLRLRASGVSSSNQVKVAVK